MSKSSAPRQSKSLHPKVYVIAFHAEFGGSEHGTESGSKVTLTSKDPHETSSSSSGEDSPDSDDDYSEDKDALTPAREPKKSKRSRYK
jgi:hypothetical protein